MNHVTKCYFCGRLFEANEFTSLSQPACPRCQGAAKRNDFPGVDTPPTKQKKFVESDGFFDEKEYLKEDKGSEFFEASEFHNLNN